MFVDQGDSAKYIVERRRFERPSLKVPPNGPKYEWPIGVEGLRISGTPGLAIHNYLGDNAPVVQITHRDARRLVMTGVLPGKTGSENMRDLIAVITAVPTLGYWILSLPSMILSKEQQVMIEDYSFDHAEDNRTDDWSYSISFVMTGVGAKRSAPKKTQAPVNPISTKKPPKGKSTRIFVTKNGASTLRAVSKIVYGNPARWREIYNKNKKVLDSLHMTSLELQYRHLPFGLKLNY